MRVHIVKAPAKINLFLEVKGRREDGYHEIRSIVQTISLMDYLKISYIKNSLQFECRNGTLDPENNTITRTFHAIEKKVGKLPFGLKIILHKNIPVSAGLGGGSSDAAALIRFLAPRVGLSLNDALTLAAEIGSDVPALVLGGTVLIEGRGDKVTALKPLPEMHVELSWPDAGVSTKDAYGWLDESSQLPETGFSIMDCYNRLQSNDISCIFNSFQEVVKSKVKKVEDLLDSMHAKYGNAYLTGSGGCVYSITPGGRYRFLPPFETW